MANGRLRAANLRLPVTISPAYSPLLPFLHWRAVGAHDMETCENCGRIIGNLETPHAWRERVVCAECRQRLDRNATPEVPPPPPLNIAGHAAAIGVIPYGASAPPPPPFAMRHGERICPNPNCGYCGSGKKEARGSRLLFILLILVWIIPGLIYWAVCGGYRIVCPKCGMEWSVELR